MATKQRYTGSVREAFDRMRQEYPNKAIAAIARDLGVPKTTLYGWITAEKAGSYSGTGEEFGQLAQHDAGDDNHYEGVSPARLGST